MNMKRIYAIARIEWLAEDKGGIRHTRKGFFCQPAVFNSQPDVLVDLFMHLKEPASPGDVVEAPVMVHETDTAILKPDTVFRLKPDGMKTVAIGRVINVIEGDIEEIDYVFHSVPKRRKAGKVTLQLSVEDMEKILDAEYAVETGSLWLIRQGQFNKDIADRLLDALDKISFGEATCFPKSLVSMLWFIPVMLYWNQPRVLERSKTTEDDYDRFCTQVIGRLYDVLGEP